MSLKITHLKHGRVVFDSANDGGEFKGAVGDYGITYRPDAPSVASDLAWMTEEEERASYESRHGIMNGEADEFDEVDDEPMEDEAS